MTITVSTVILLMAASFVLFAVAFYLAANRIIDAVERRISSPATPTKGMKNDPDDPEMDLGADNHHSAR